MTEKRFTFGAVSPNVAMIKDNGKPMDIGEVVDCLNEQQATIQQLKAKLKEKEEDEQLYANEIVKLNKEAKEVLDFKSLGGDY